MPSSPAVQNFLKISSRFQMPSQGIVGVNNEIGLYQKPEKELLLYTALRLDQPLIHKKLSSIVSSFEKNLVIYFYPASTCGHIRNKLIVHLRISVYRLPDSFQYYLRVEYGLPSLELPISPYRSSPNSENMEPRLLSLAASSVSRQVRDRAFQNIDRDGRHLKKNGTKRC